MSEVTHLPIKWIVDRIRRRDQLPRPETPGVGKSLIEAGYPAECYHCNTNGDYQLSHKYCYHCKRGTCSKHGNWLKKIFVCASCDTGHRASD